LANGAPHARVSRRNPEFLREGGTVLQSDTKGNLNTQKKKKGKETKPLHLILALQQPTRSLCLCFDKQSLLFLSNCSTNLPVPTGSETKRQSV
jgi:hypothetical protein